MAAFDLLVVGDYCLDLIFTGLPGAPRSGREIIASGFEMIPGGAYTTAVAAHRLGLSVGWACDFGTDAFSRLVNDRMLEEGLDTTLAIHHQRSLRKITVALSSPEDRSFVAYYDPGPAIPAGFKALARATARALYLPGLYFGPLLEAGLLAMRAKKMKLVMDGNSNEEIHLSNPAVRKAIAAADVFLLNESEAARLTDAQGAEKALQILSKVGKLVVVKRGAQGAISLLQGEIIHVPAIAVDPLDTTGAGDCFNAGFLRAWLDGKPLRDCLLWGNICGGLSTLGYGGTGRIVSATDITAWIEKDA